MEACPTLFMNIHTGFQQVYFILFNNTISDCSTDKSILTVLSIGLRFPVKLFLTIANCTFTELKGINKDDPTLFSVETRNPLIFSINSSLFIYNKDLILVSLNAFSNREFYPTSVNLNVYNTIIRNNMATSVLVRVFCLDFQKVSIVLKDTIVDTNIILLSRTRRPYKASISDTIDIEVSIFSFSTVEKVLIEDSSFSGNQGTPLTIEKKADTHLSFKEEIRFTNNTGVLGGAFGLRDVHVIIQTSPNAKLLFEDNTGMYGGVLYLNNVIISVTTCKMKLKIINNIAARSGNLVYFATIPQGFILNCSFNDIKIADIGSPVF